MKKWIFNSFMIMALCVSAFSQSLQNTTWYVYNPSNVLTYYFHFGRDTSFISTNFITYYPLSIFSENGNVFTIHDITGSAMACPATDTGYYTFTIRHDTLLFTLVSDPCTPRTAVLTTYHWVQNTTGIETQNTTQAIQVFPNPSADGIFTLQITENGFEKFSVNSVEGKLLFETIISGEGNNDYAVNLSSFPSGTYLLTLYGKQGNKVFKLVR